MSRARWASDAMHEIELEGGVIAPRINADFHDIVMGNVTVDEALQRALKWEPPEQDEDQR
ncbi:hypothetical protein [Rhodococcus sp. ACT016]|uniref:antitoxin VbhA family protein n=1 Tax=Rhodococcus sp. ACT016 TaxID=3134808 RepID=UPI003D2925E8